MIFFKHLILFINNNLLQLRRKWLSLPLLLLFPIIMIGLIITIVLALFSPTQNDPIQVGIVNLDQTNETEVIVNLITESSQFGDFMNIHELSASEADQQIEDNKLSTYIMFPDQFTSKLYQGESVSLSITGNPKQPTESYVIKELIDSITRHISSAQASILTINHYAKELQMDDDARNDMLFEQFTDFLLYTIGKDKIIQQKTLTNHMTASPIDYYVLASWFIIVIVWLLLVFNFLYKDDAIQMKKRMRLYGVTELQQLFARMIVTLTFVSLFAMGSFMMIESLLTFEFIKEDYMRVLLIICIHSIIFLVCLAMIEIIVPAQKIRLLLQALLTFILIMISGAIVPTSYFPLKIQAILPNIFSFHGFYWLQEIVLNERLYVDLMPLIWMGVIGLLILVMGLLWKERVKS